MMLAADLTPTVPKNINMYRSAENLKEDCHTDLLPRWKLVAPSPGWQHSTQLQAERRLFMTFMSRYLEP